TKLAFQDRKPGIQRRRGLGSVRIADLRTGGMVEREAITGRASVSFSNDGRRVVATHITHVDGEEQLGFRVWDTSSLELVYSTALPGWSLGSIATGVAEGSDFVAVYGNGGNMEMRDLSDDVLFWSVPLLPPQFA